MQKKYPLLRGVLCLIGLYHVAFGLAANLPAPQVQAAAAAVLGVRLPAEPALYHVLKPFGIYAIVFGAMMLVAAWNPVKNRALISLGVVLFLLRIGQRLLNLDGVQQDLGVTAARNWATIGTVGVLALLLSWLRWQLYRDMHGVVATTIASQPG